MGMYANFWSVVWVDEDTKMVHRLARADRNPEIYDEAMKYGGEIYSDEVYFTKEEAQELSDRLARMSAAPDYPQWKAQQALDAALAIEHAIKDEGVETIYYEASA